MSMTGGDLRERLLGAFRGESVERMQVLSSDFMKLEKGGDSQAMSLLVESSYRELHSLKGAARAVGLGAVEKFCQCFESFFSVIKKNDLILSKDVCAAMLSWLDILDEMIHQEDTSDESLAAPAAALALSQMKNFAGSSELIDTCSPDSSSQAVECKQAAESCSFAAGDNAESGSHEDNCQGDYSVKPSAQEDGCAVDTTPTRSSMSDTVRISSSFITGLLLRTEELISSRNSQKSRAREVLELESLFNEYLHFFQNIYEDKKSTAGKDELSTYTDMDKKLDAFSRRLGMLSSEVQKASWELSSKVDSLLGDFKSSMLLPFSSLLDMFPRMVRTLSAEKGKKCELEIIGENVHIDRRILEMLHDPLMHMIRNSIDHGIEEESVRTASGKPATGRIFFSITQTDRDVVKIVYGDDGQGIDSEKLRQLAVSQGFVSMDEAKRMERRSVLELIFVSGMSTSEIITDISGRGLGMAIVRDKVESLGGSVVVASPEGKGIRVVMNIPVALTSFIGIVVGVGGKEFVVPKSGVRKVLLIRQEDIGTVGGKETILYSGRPIPLISLSDILELGVAEVEKSSFPVFIMGRGRKAIAISMEELLGEQDVMAKSMGPMLKRVRNVSGISMLGTGKLAPILHGPDMIRTALGINSGVKNRSFSHQVGVKKLKTVLVVEDSITSRMLLKNVLEAAGYNVITAVDGRDGLSRIKQELPDILVSDVEMPHMDGFTLTAAVRKMPQSTHLPIVLVTSLGSQEDRERGVEAGADAYIIKSSFDQGNLLEVISRLIG
ncbi:hybrid sensor histidine kinase/response regulator [Maridesulfovibrio hydrothermalis]|uniref:histidine kinase n=1 Tax=Maridesulfovibrio hydrothermalis AM13 = DSM 14728 TaxID=1121451 RepID=L0RED2_9BACT|nr:response regulator [Maridesulfovibrio hydrothermalis]CCO25158.1 CheA signal transduction histidine kinase [Maridesulfovibrio hydrothermalis AM13 = DSM 14728]